jgi:hypothetical protein
VVIGPPATERNDGRVRSALVTVPLPTTPPTAAASSSNVIAPRRSASVPPTAWKNGNESPPSMSADV